MFSGMKPSLRLKDIYDIDLYDLRSIGIKGLAFDIDNTLEPYKSPLPSERLTAWLKEAASLGFKIAFISNAKPGRIEKFAGALTDIDIIVATKAKKPLKKGFKFVCEQMNFRPDQIVMCGDQLYTDILGGNGAGYMTILVDPIEPAIEPPFVKFKRILEKPFL